MEDVVVTPKYTNNFLCPACNGRTRKSKLKPGYRRCYDCGELWVESSCVKPVKIPIALSPEVLAQRKERRRVYAIRYARKQRMRQRARDLLRADNGPD